jgi:hypothetical protein
MNRIPVFRTIGKAYGFAFGSLGTITGLIWLPVGLLAATQYYESLRLLSGYQSAYADGNLYALNDAYALRYLSMVVVLLLQAIIVTPVMRQALGLRSGRALVSFAVGPTMLRVFGAMIALAVVLIALEYIAIILLVIIAIVAGVAANLAGPANGLSGEEIAGLGFLGALMLLAIVAVFVAVRLSFFVVAVAVAERKIDLIRAWRLSQSNFWRVFVIVLATMLPLSIIYGALLWAALGFPLLHGLSMAELSVWKDTPTKALVIFIHWFSDRLPYIFGAGAIIAPFSVGLSTGAAAAAYRALVPSMESEGPVPPAVLETSTA